MFYVVSDDPVEYTTVFFKDHMDMSERSEPLLAPNGQYAICVTDSYDEAEMHAIADNAEVFVKGQGIVFDPKRKGLT